MEEVVLKAVTWTPVFQSAVLTVGTFVSFVIAYAQGDVSIYVPFISETGSVIPEMGIFSLTCVFGSFVGVITTYYRYLVVKCMVDKEDTLLLRLNRWALVAGFLSMAGLVGVASFPMSALLFVHVFAAVVHFAPVVAYGFAHAYISLKMKPPYYHSFISKMRVLMSLALGAFLLILAVCLPVGYFNWIKVNPDKPPALKTPEDKVFMVNFFGALFEWFAYGIYLTYVFSFLWEFRKFEPALTVRPAVQKAITEVNVNGAFEKQEEA